MERRRRSSLVGGILLILIGAWFAALQLMPGLRAWFNIEVTWPLFIVAVGFILLVVGLVTAVPGLAIPAYRPMSGVHFLKNGKLNCVV